MSRVAAAVAVSALTALPGPALAAWERPQTLARTVRGGAPVLAVAGNGDALAAWYAGGAAVAAVRAGSSRRFGAPRTISRGGDPDRLALAAGPDGRGAAVWEYRAGRGGGVWLAERPVGGPWRVGSALAELGVSARWPGIAIEPAGGLLATYWSGGPVVSAIRSATGTFGAPAPLSPAGESAEDPRLVTGPRGDALVAWGQPSAAGEGLRAAYRPPGAAFGAAEAVPGPGTVFAGQSVGVALGPEGQAVIAQVRTEPARRAVVIAERAAGGAWSVPVVLAESTGPFGMASPQVAIDLAGNAVATWARFDGRHWVVDVSERSAATPTWSTPVTLSPASRDASRPALAVSPAGRAVVAWQEKRGAVIVLRARARPAPGTPFGASVTVGSSGPRRRGVPYQIAQVEPRIAFGPRERAITVWGSCFRDKLKGGGLGPVCLVQASSEK